MYFFITSFKAYYYYLQYQRKSDSDFCSIHNVHPVEAPSNPGSRFASLTNKHRATASATVKTRPFLLVVLYHSFFQRNLYLKKK